MSKITWDGLGERIFESGVEKAVLYPFKNNAYTKGIAWNGITAINENPSGGEPTALWADDFKYANIMSSEEYGATVEAYMYPDEFAECDGSANIATGVSIGQQKRIPFGLSYVTKIGNDVEGLDHGYKIHIIYGALAKPSEKSHETINDSPDADTFSWELSTTPVKVNIGKLKPTASVEIDSTKADATELAALEDILYGVDADATNNIEATEPRLPLPDELATIFRTSAIANG